VYRAHPKSKSTVLSKSQPVQVTDIEHLVTFLRKSTVFKVYLSTQGKNGRYKAFWIGRQRDIEGKTQEAGNGLMQGYL